jgi:hypothetical protein
MPSESSELTEHSWIVLTRKREAFGLLRKLQVFIDGREIDRLSPAAEVCYPVTPGEHTVRVWMDWCTNKPYALHLAEGEVATLECGLRTRKLYLMHMLVCLFAPYRLFDVRTQPTPLAASKEGVLTNTRPRSDDRTGRSWIVLMRKREWFALLRDFRICIDEREVDRLPLATQQCYPVRPGEHTVHVQLDWCTSEPHPVRLADGDTVMLECGLRPGNPYPMPLILRVLAPDLLLEVRRQATAFSASEEGVRW